MGKGNEWIILMFEPAEVSKNTNFLELPKNTLLAGALSVEDEVNMASLGKFMTLFKKNYFFVQSARS